MGLHRWRVAALLAALSPSAHAAPAPARYDIPAQPLDQALLQLGAAAGRPIAFTPETVKGRTSRPVHGEFALPVALAQMLPAGLEAESRGSLMIVRVLPQAAQDAKTAAEAPPTPASQTATATATEPAPWTPLEALVVTALKYDTLLQQTPVSISYVGTGLAERGETSLNDFYRRIPGLHLTSNATTQQRMAIRGVRGSGEATTGLYYDETPVTGPAGSAADAGATQPDISLFDVQRIEVLRGPQGTLYGAGSMGGTVRVIFNKPLADRQEGRVVLRGGFTASGSPTTSLRAVANLPLSRDRLALRVAVYGERVGGYIDNVRFDREDINDALSGGFRATLAYTPTPTLNVSGMAVHQSERANDAVSYWYPRLGRYKTDATIIGEYRSKLDLYNLTGRWETPSAIFVATASRYRWATRTLSDYTSTLERSVADPSTCSNYFSTAAACDAGQSATFSAYAQSRIPGAWNQPSILRSAIEEVRGSSTGDAAFNWTIGAFHEVRSDSFDSIVYRADAASGLVLTHEQPTGYRMVKTSVRQIAGFGEASLRPMKALTLTVGVRRYSYDKTVGGEVFIANRITGSAVTPYRQVEASHQGWVTKLSAAAQPTAHILVYTTRSEGFRPGGANNVPGAGAEVPETYAPDALVSYELGAKIGLAGGRITVNTAAYRIDWSDMQVSASSANGAWRFNTNAGKAQIDGGEIEIIALPVKGLWVMVNGAYTDAKLVGDQRNGLGVATGRVGDRLPFTPTWTGAFSLVHRQPVFSYNTVSRFDYSYTGSSASDFRESLVTYQRQPPYSVVDIQFAAERGGIETSVRVSNLLGVSGPQMVLTNLSGVRDQTYSIRPRTLTLGLRRSF